MSDNLITQNLTWTIKCGGEITRISRNKDFVLNSTYSLYKLMLLSKPDDDNTGLNSKAQSESKTLPINANKFTLNFTHLCMAG